MAVDPVSVLYTGLFLAVVSWFYGFLVAVAWTPFLVAGRVRGLFSTLPPAGWIRSYALWTPVPAAVWGFLFGCVLPLSREFRPPSRASELYLAGVDGITVATLVSLPLWPAVLLSLLPARGIDWDPHGYGPKTALLLVVATVWYLLSLVGPAYAFSVFAGVGDAMSAT